MDKFTYFGLARAVHVVGVVLWIGGVAFVTTTLIPSIRNMSDTDQRLTLFERLEGRRKQRSRFFIDTPDALAAFDPEPGGGTRNRGGRARIILFFDAIKFRLVEPSQNQASRETINRISTATRFL